MNAWTLIALLAGASVVDVARADCTPQPAEPWITLEVIAGEVALDEAVEVVDIDRRGCATVRYASFDTRAGLYRRQLGKAEQQALATSIAQKALLAFDADALQKTLDDREYALRKGLVADAPARATVACGDTYRLALEADGGAARIEWYAPKQAARRHPKVQPLQDLVAIIDAVQAVGAAPGKTRVAEVAP